MVAIDTETAITIAWDEPPSRSSWGWSVWLLLDVGDVVIWMGSVSTLLFEVGDVVIWTGSVSTLLFEVVDVV